LIDAYLRNELTPERRQRFEQNYLTTEARRERVAMAAALLRHVDERRAAATATVTGTLSASLRTTKRAAANPPAGPRTRNPCRLPHGDSSIELAGSLHRTAATARARS
jgi:anti-sigma factor RsiW